MKGWGSVLLVVGLLLAAGALLMDTTVYSPGMPAIGGYGGSDGLRTQNLGLLQAQLLVFHGGCALFVGGSVLFAVGAILERQDAAAWVARNAPDADQANGVLLEERADLVRDRKASERMLLVVFGGLAAALVLFLLFQFAGSGGRSAEDAAIISNADALADNMEAQADELDRLTNELTAPERRRGR